jgi:hypothetical protein
MAAVFNPGQILGASDLRIYITDNNGNPMNVYSINYTIYDYGNVGRVPFGTPILVPNEAILVQGAIGFYYINWLIPCGTRVGPYEIRWSWLVTPDSQLTEVRQPFSIVVPGQCSSNTDLNF